MNDCSPVFIDDTDANPSVSTTTSVFAAGNPHGDFQMLEWTTSGKGPRLAMIIHHTDAERQWGPTTAKAMSENSAKASTKARSAAGPLSA
jgi:hypothetical protein